MKTAHTNTSFLNLRGRLRDTGFLWGPETHCYGVNGFVTYGPTGKQLKLRIESIFRKIFENCGFFEIETPCLYASKAWLASGHLEKFTNEMFTTSTSDGVNLCGRPELATTIFSLLPLLLHSFNEKTPLKIYQTGITLPNDQQTEYQTRTRQYTAHEGHLIFKKGEFDCDQTIDSLKEMAMSLMSSVAIPKEILQFREKTGKDKPFYAAKAFGLYAHLNEQPELELLGIQYRSSYDFKKHNQTLKGKFAADSTYPEDFEISFSSDRPIYVILQILLHESDGRVYLDLPPSIAPYTFLVLPVDTDFESIKIAQEIAKKITPLSGPTPVLTSGKMTVRYQQSDLMGIPYVIIIDKSQNIFIRERNSGHQFPILLDRFFDLLIKTSDRVTLCQKIHLLISSS